METIFVKSSFANSCTRQKNVITQKKLNPTSNIPCKFSFFLKIFSSFEKLGVDEYFKERIYFEIIDLKTGRMIGYHSCMVRDFEEGRDEVWKEDCESNTEFKIHYESKISKGEATPSEKEIEISTSICNIL